MIESKGLFCLKGKCNSVMNTIIVNHLSRLLIFASRGR